MAQKPLYTGWRHAEQRIIVWNGMGCPLYVISGVLASSEDAVTPFCREGDIQAFSGAVNMGITIAGVPAQLNLCSQNLTMGIQWRVGGNWLAVLIKRGRV